MAAVEPEDQFDRCVDNVKIDNNDLTRFGNKSNLIIEDDCEYVNRCVFAEDQSFLLSLDTYPFPTPVTFHIHFILILNIGQNQTRDRHVF